MKAQVHLPPDLWNEALQVATHDAFPEVIRILQLFQTGAAELSEAEATHLRAFARFLLQRAALHYPYWDDSQQPYVADHEDSFQEVNMGLHEKLLSSIGSAFPNLLK